MKAMRRNDREVTDFAEITDILCRAETIRLGLHGEPYPYVVALSFGFEALDDKITLYFHGATEGLKHDLIQRNPLVCVETDILHRYAAVGNNVTAEYESFIGFGKAERISSDQAVKGIDLLLEHCGYNDFEYDKAALSHTWVYKIEMDSFTAKRRTL
ncbi:MAG: pyridoxamine 5'-phosphate oxidase family protein [Oscillospiraceae bacterium]|nr:pyridoxamine 5'-phosphate oxidase family protein [Oscillospiraceae bacterium]